uniref:Uncharacterized protein n=1 Tax=Glossina brevipalpis TaxID=37001 RepID=A0A1A9WED1_9MUSC
MIFRIIFTLVALVTPALCSQTKQQPDKYVLFQQHFDSCKKEQNVNQVDIARLRLGHLKQVSNEAKCFLACLYEKTEILKNGALQEDALKTYIGFFINSELMEEIIPPCHLIDGANKCDRAFKLKKCFLKVAFGDIWLSIPNKYRKDPQYGIAMRVIDDLTNVKYKIAFA